MVRLSIAALLAASAVSAQKIGLDVNKTTGEYTVSFEEKPWLTGSEFVVNWLSASSGSS